MARAWALLIAAASRPPRVAIARRSAARGLALLALTATLLACGGSSNTGSGGAQGGGGQGGSTSDGGAGDGGAGGGAEDGYTLTVTDGYGSGTYAAGEIVHVWAAVNPADDLLLGWTGDSELLEGPAEWHSTLVMPARDVALAASFEPRPFAITEVVVPGAERDKTVRFHVPADPKGLVAVLHGTGGNGDFLLRPETLFVARKLVEAGYAVFSTDAEEVDAGDSNDNGSLQWDASLAPDNVDLLNLTILYDSFEAQGLVPAGVPRFVFGMSNGGSMSVTVGAALGVTAAISYCASGRAAAAEATQTPTAWFLCGQDQNNQVNNDTAQERHETLLANGVPTELVVTPPSPLYPERFSRVAGIDLATSAAMVDDLTAAGFLDAAGFVTAFSPAIQQALIDDPASFPAWQAIPPNLANQALGQLRIATADHRFYDDLAARTLAWFEAAR